MKNESIRDYLIINGEIEETSTTKIFEKIEKPSVYEVLRVMDGVPLFLEEHLRRMEDSANLIDYKIEREKEQIKEDIKMLISKNKIKDLNVKLISTELKEGRVFLVYNLESFYPPEKYYLGGIDTALFHHERSNPNAKVLISSFKDDMANFLREKNVFEALLVDKEGYIKEGSRSNMFFVKGENVYTAKGVQVLMGITREYIVRACQKLNIKILEESIHIDEIGQIDGAFMSGTSVNVLPIRTIDGVQLNSVNNSVIKRISEGYEKEIVDYMNGYKSKVF